MADHQTIQAGLHKVAVVKDLRVPMRDGVTLAADVYSGMDDKPRPALVALSPYGKELQALALTMPPQRRPSPLWDGCIEAGDIAQANAIAAVLAVFASTQVAAATLAVRQHGSATSPVRGSRESKVGRCPAVAPWAGLFSVIVMSSS